MGLLDALFSSSDSGGGLLDLIRQSQAPAPAFNDRFPSNGIEYPGDPSGMRPLGHGLAQAAQSMANSSQPNAIDNAAWPVGPVGAPSPSFADRFNAMPGAAPQPFTPSGRSFDSAQFDPATFAPNQASPIAVGSNYQMPRMGDAGQYQPQQAMTPPNAQPAQGQLPPGQSMPAPQMQAPQQPAQGLPPAFGGTSYLERLNAGGGLIGSMLGDTTQQKNLTAQFHAIRQALIENGETPRAAESKAMIAAMNPEAAKTIIPELFTSKQKYGVVSENPIEGKKYGFVNERDQTINGQPVGAGSGSQSTGGLLAPGKSYDPNLSGDAYMAQFSPEVQAAAKAYINGDVLPSGNPRQQGIASQAKTIAMKYGQDMGIPVSDALFSEKRKYRTELGTNSPNSAGGQAKAFNQGISHLTSLADNLEKLDNSNGLGIPVIAQGVNAVRQGTSTTQSAISDEAKTLGQTVAGEVGKLFSGSAGGGVHERELTRDRFDTVKSKPQLAAALRATLETMDGGLKALEQRRDAVLGPNSGVELVSAETKANIAKIQAAIDRLEGKAPAAAKPSALPSGWSVKVN